MKNWWRVSNLEEFRKFEMDDEYEVHTLVNRLVGDFSPSEAMLAGTAFHKYLELSPEGIALDVFEQDGFTFSVEGDFTLELPVIRELRASKKYMVDGIAVTVSGQVDALEGKRVDDTKTTGSFSPDRYLEGYQWRYYLDIFGADHFRWNVFELFHAASDPERFYRVRAHHPLEQHRYPGLERDCQALVERFARFVRTYIPTQEAADAIMKSAPQEMEAAA